jgi:pyruvate/2-oxoglutarate dehydrogenase complex dihydrolipoamide acyltransferase (E2) component
MSVSQIADYISEAEPSTDEILDIIRQTPEPSRENMANMFLAAEAEASGGEPRDDLIAGIAEEIGLGSAVGPEGSEGVPGTEGQEETGDGSDEGGADGGSGGEGTTTPAAEPTDSAKTLAEQEGIDLAQVTGTGRDGRVTQQDVQKFIQSQQESNGD